MYGGGREVKLHLSHSLHFLSLYSFLPFPSFLSSLLLLPFSPSSPFFSSLSLPLLPSSPPFISSLLLLPFSPSPPSFLPLYLSFHPPCCSYPPFFDEHPFRIYEKILEGKIEWPRQIDQSAKDLIKKLLVRDVTRRLGSLRVRGCVRVHVCVCEGCV